jgi:hypothetical protein
MFSFESFLTLDRSTLFYWSLSDVPRKRGSAINEWASAISTGTQSQDNLKSTLQGPKSTNSRTNSTGIIPSLTGGGSRSSAPSILTDNIKVISHQSSGQVKVKVEAQADGVISLSDEGGLSDNDELGGKEREAAINSPLKGKKRITSEVTSHHFHFKYLILLISRNSSRYLTNPQRRQAIQHPKSLETRNYPIGLKLNGSGTPLSQLIWRLSVKPSILGRFLPSSRSW